MQFFKSISFNEKSTGRSKIVSVAFTDKEKEFYSIVNKLSSIEVRRLINIDSYEDLLALSSRTRRSLSQVVKLLLEKALMKNKHIISASDVTFKNSKTIPFQRWYPYIEGYSIDFVKTLIQEYIDKECIIYEPFAGTGTTLFASDTMGFSTYYSEINPLLQFLITTKLKVLNLNIEERRSLVKDIQAETNSLLVYRCKENETLKTNYKNVFKKSVYFPEGNFSKILKTRSFLDSIKDPMVKDILTIGVLASLIPSSLLKKQGDLRFRTKKELEKGIEDFSDIFNNRIKEICEDLKNQIEYRTAKEHVCIIKNAKNIKEANCEKIGCVITSPPYLNGTNYIRNTKLELWFLRELTTDRDLRRFRDEILTSGINDVKVTTSTQYDMEDKSKLYKETIEKLKETAYDIRIPQMAKCYFSEMYMLFEGLTSKLEKGADLLIDIGDSIFNNVHIKTDIILQEIASTLGFELIENKKLRERRSRNGQIISQVLIHLKYNPK